MPKVPKLRSFISLQYLHKNMGDEVDVLPVDKHKSFLQDDSTQSPKYSKQQVCNTFAICQGKS